MSIVVASPKDLDRICYLYEQFYSYYASIQPDYYKESAANKDYYARALESVNDVYFLAVADDQPVGFCHVSEKETPPVEFYVHHRFAVLMEMFIISSYRGSGVGKELMDAARKWTADRELDYLELRVLQLNDYAKRFYENAGFDVSAYTMRCVMD